MNLRNPGALVCSRTAIHDSLTALHRQAHPCKSTPHLLLLHSLRRQHEACIARLLRGCLLWGRPAAVQMRRRIPLSIGTCSA